MAIKKHGRPKVLTDAQYRKKREEATARWRKEHSASVNLSLNKEKDADIIAWLETHKPKQAYIRRLIRDDMERGGN